MNTKLVEDIAAAVLYEGYLLYPYRATAIKNKQRWNFGVLYPQAYAEQQSGSDTWNMRTECLVRAPAEAAPCVRVRFLHLIRRTIEGQNCQGAMEREITLPSVPLSEPMSRPVYRRFAFLPAADQEPLGAAVAL